ncbi:MAG: tetratricopeptide repeat protein [Alphaproteobacteria bacterium]|nr:tetratricopeptide repeat protein [Alphaproteobacteria bacterium]MBU1513892.1 tetratricopeptide repeat protein [Alphaproteobacteria bacterium]MBU2094463.1 tetratricopeptide repeat protein [Alphaproteobacteria bacterium]MBU2149811.1 tetratricopeptide repeat protein [Alphaproteobacteria bacterium]MBU2307282.1 tetratricopeptide repeat protein [Alphaproteobacteria bacterium]
MTDLFEEVEEQLRSDRYKQFARKALPWMLGIAAAALIATLGYWGYDSYRNKQIATASEQYSSAVDAMVAGDKTKAQQLWTEVSKSNAKAYKALSLMHLGAFALEARKPADAVKLFDEAAAAAPDPIVGDAARLKSAFALLDTAPLKDLEGRLKPLMEEGHPYRVQAREALAFAKLNAGDLAGARGDFVLITQSLDAQQGAQARAQAAIGLIDSGSAKAVPAVVKAAEALPPMTMDPGAMIGPPQGPGQPQPQGPAPQ